MFTGCLLVRSRGPRHPIRSSTASPRLPRRHSALGFGAPLCVCSWVAVFRPNMWHHGRLDHISPRTVPDRFGHSDRINCYALPWKDNPCSCGREAVAGNLSCRGLGRRISPHGGYRQRRGVRQGHWLCQPCNVAGCFGRPLDRWRGIREVGDTMLCSGSLLGSSHSTSCYD